MMPMRRSPKKHWQEFWAIYMYLLVIVLVAYMYFGQARLDQAQEDSVIQGMELLVVANAVSLGLAGASTNTVGSYLKRTGFSGLWRVQLRDATILLMTFPLFGIITGSYYIVSATSIKANISWERLVIRHVIFFLLIGGVVSIFLAWRAMLGAELENNQPENSDS